MKKRILLLLSVGTTLAVFSQADSSVSAIINESKIAVDAGDPVFVGPEHMGYLSSIEGTAYYSSPEWQKGTVVFQQVFYTDVYLKYDLVTDELVIRHFDKYSRVILFTPRVGSFTLGNRRFINLAAGDNFKKGFYEELSMGKVSLYAKHTKQLDQTATINGIERKFSEKHEYYLLKDERYYRVKSDKALIDLLSDKKTAIKDWLKRSGIKYKQDPETALKKIADYYNQLTR
jgi:hypothetical protein